MDIWDSAREALMGSELPVGGDTFDVLGLLSEGYGTAKTGVQTVVGAMQTAAGAVQSVSGGIETLVDGAKTVANVPNTVVHEAPSLTDGANALADGASTLVHGAGSIVSDGYHLVKGVYDFVKGAEYFGEGVIDGLALDPINGVTQSINYLAGTHIDKIEFGNQTEVSNSTMGRVGEFSGIALGLLGVTSYVRALGEGAVLATRLAQGGYAVSALGGSLTQGSEDRLAK